MKYDSQAIDIKNKLNQASKALIVIPEEVNTDKVAAALSLYLALQQSGKQAFIASSAKLDGQFNNLIGLNDIQNIFPQSGGGNYILSLEGVVDDQGRIPLEKMDYYPEGRNLNLVFSVLPGQSFQPTNVSVKNDGEGSSSDLIFIIGATNILNIGEFYTHNLEKFADVPKINIDNSQNNNLFGVVNIVDSASTLSEIMMDLINDLSLPVDSNIASNLISGIYQGTANFTTHVTQETFMFVGQAMQKGGKLPQGSVVAAPQSTPIMPQPTPVMPNPAPSPVAPTQPAQSQFINPAPVNPPSPVSNPNFSFLMPNEQNPINITTPNTQPITNNQAPHSQSYEEKPTGEYTTSSSPENAKPAPDWLTPKIYKGGSVG